MCAKANKLRVRLPLPGLTVASPTAERLRPFTDLTADEMNVKSVTLATDADRFGCHELTVNTRAAGPRLGKQVQQVIKAVKAGTGRCAPNPTVPRWSPPTVSTWPTANIRANLVAVEPDSTAELPGGAGLVVLDTAVTEELEAEGWAKDRVREPRTPAAHGSRRLRPYRGPPGGTRRTHRLGPAPRRPIAGEVLAVTFDVVPTESGSGAIELGDGVTADITRSGS